MKSNRIPIITPQILSYTVKKYPDGFIGIANYIIDHNATVRQTAKAFGISKSTVHTVVTKQNA